MIRYGYIEISYKKQAHQLTIDHLAFFEKKNYFGLGNIIRFKLMQGLSYHSIDKINEAKKILENLEENQVSYEKSLYLYFLGRIQLQKNNPLNAVNYFIASIDRSGEKEIEFNIEFLKIILSDYKPDLMLQIEDYRRKEFKKLDTKNDLTKQLTEINCAIYSNPLNSELYFNRATIHIKNNQMLEAERDLNVAFKLSTDEKFKHLCQELKKTSVLTALTKRNEHVDSEKSTSSKITDLINKAKDYQDQHKYKQADKHLKKAKKIANTSDSTKDTHLLLQKKINISNNLQNEERGNIHAINKLLEKSKLLVEQKNYPAAIESLEKAAGINTQSKLSYKEKDILNETASARSLLEKEEKRIATAKKIVNDSIEKVKKYCLEKNYSAAKKTLANANHTATSFKFTDKITEITNLAQTIAHEKKLEEENKQKIKAAQKALKELRREKSQKEKEEENKKESLLHIQAEEKSKTTTSASESSAIGKATLFQPTPPNPAVSEGIKWEETHNKLREMLVKNDSLTNIANFRELNKLNILPDLLGNLICTYPAIESAFINSKGKEDFYNHILPTKKLYETSDPLILIYAHIIAFNTLIQEKTTSENPNIIIEKIINASFLLRYANTNCGALYGKENTREIYELEHLARKSLEYIKNANLIQVSITPMITVSTFQPGPT